MADRPDLDALIVGLRIASHEASCAEQYANAFLFDQSAIRLAALQARADQAEQRIADAPHDYHCNVSHGINQPCDCWKAEL